MVGVTTSGGAQPGGWPKICCCSSGGGKFRLNSFLGFRYCGRRKQLKSFLSHRLPLYLSKQPLSDSSALCVIGVVRIKTPRGYCRNWDVEVIHMVNAEGQIFCPLT